MSLIRFSTDALPTRDRAPVFRDLVGRRFINTEMMVNPAYPRPFYFSMALAMGETVRIAEVDFAAVDVHRRAADLHDGDDGVTCFLPTGVPVRSEHRDRRGVIRPGGAVLIGHAAPGASCWPDNHVTLLMFPRAYLRSVWRDAEAGAGVPPAVERNLVAIVAGLAAHTADGMRRAAWPALGPARVAAMREVIARRAAEPGLSMREVAAAVGLSERSGHLTFAAAALSFSECLAGARLDLVRARLETGRPGRIIDIALDAGFGDVAHFNRLFRRRFAMTPSDMLHRGRATA